MKVRNTQEAEKIELQMTPMIDIVFQLLIFFIMTFKIVVQEGDFNIKMPLAAPSEGLPEDDLNPPVLVKLRANSQGQLVGCRVNDETTIQLENQPGHELDKLREFIVQYIGNEGGPSSGASDVEVEFDVDFNLRYEYTVAAVTAVSGYTDREGNVVKLIEKIKFKPPGEDPNG